MRQMDSFFGLYGSWEEKEKGRGGDFESDLQFCVPTYSKLLFALYKDYSTITRHKSFVLCSVYTNVECCL
jgi:hypothetical protein